MLTEFWQDGTVIDIPEYNNENIKAIILFNESNRSILIWDRAIW